MNDRLVLTDDLLRRALEQRMAHSPSPQLLDRIVAGAADTTQDRAPRAWLGGRRRAGSGSRPIARWWEAAPALAGVAAVALVALLVTFVLRPVPGPGGTPTPIPSATATPGPTPLAVDVGDHAAMRLNLGVDAGPIDLIFADGSIWNANIRAGDIRRFDPSTMAEIARIPLPAGQGPGWFAETDGTLWASNQLGGGMDRIDMATNTLVGVVGDAPTCGQPVVAFESIWQAACDANVIMRIDPATGAVEEIPADFYGFLLLAGGQMYAASSVQLATFDPETRAFEPLAIEIDGIRQLLASDGASLWVATDGGVLRIDPLGGETLATFPYTDVVSVTFSSGQAWMTRAFVGVVQVDLATNQEVETIPVNVPNPIVAREAAGAIWVTDFDNSNLWRVEP